MQKIVIIGPPGSGKSAFGRKLHEKLDVQLFHMDQLFWKPNWVQSSREELIEKLEAIFLKKTWIIDGNYGGTLELRLQEADTVFFFDFPRRIYFPRTIWRVLKNYGKTRDDMTEGCTEKLNFVFMKYVWNFEKNNKLNRKLIEKYKGNLKIITFCNQVDVDDFFRD